MQHLDPLARQFFQPAQHLPVLERQALERTAKHRAVGARHRLSLRGTPRADRRRHVFGAEKPGEVGVNQAAKRRCLGGQLHHLGVVVGPSLFLKRPPALLHQPQPHDVLQQSPRAIEPTLVGHVAGQRLRRQCRPREFEPHERPGSRTDVRPPPGPCQAGRHRRHGRTGVVRRRCDHRQSAQPGRLRDIGPQRPQSRPGVDNLREDIGGNLELPQQRQGPLPRPGVETLAGRGIGEFADLAPRQQPVEQVGHHQEPLGLCEQPGVLLPHGNQLIQRVDRHELQPGAGEDLGPGHAQPRLVHHPGGPTIAVVVGQPQQFFARPQQHIVDPPGVDPDRLGLPPPLGGPFRQPLLDVPPQRHAVPAQRVIPADRPIAKPVDLLQPDPPAIEQPGDHPTALRPQVHRQVTPFSHLHTLAFDQPASRSLCPAPPAPREKLAQGNFGCYRRESPELQPSRGAAAHSRSPVLSRPSSPRLPRGESRDPTAPAETRTPLPPSRAVPTLNSRRIFRPQDRPAAPLPSGGPDQVPRASASPAPVRGGAHAVGSAQRLAGTNRRGALQPEWVLRQQSADIGDRHGGDVFQVGGDRAVLFPILPVPPQ